MNLKCILLLSPFLLFSQIDAATPPAKNTMSPLTNERLSPQAQQKPAGQNTSSALYQSAGGSTAIFHGTQNSSSLYHTPVSNPATAQPPTSPKSPARSTGY